MASRVVKNKTSAYYRDQCTLNTIYNWFVNTYGYIANHPADSWQAKAGVPFTILDMYQSYCEYTIPKKYIRERIGPKEFPKCLVAAKIMQVDGYWEYIEDWEPKEYKMLRANTTITKKEANAFYFDDYTEPDWGDY